MRYDLFLGGLDRMAHRLEDHRTRDSSLTRISHRLTGQAHERPASTSLRLLAVLNGL
jgi:hypothetical protein